MERGLLSFAIVSSLPAEARKTRRMELGLVPDGRLSGAGMVAEFQLLDAAGVSDAIPDYTERTLNEVQEGLPRWDSECMVLQSATTRGT
ncbi:hypothetical protein [Streptomyces sp. NPDC048568]|uniref:hypothetical protein n=1 Tax=Streptomyces sp. NPDC048568 TaxID=3365571 RepID=UPI00371C580B